MVLFKAVTWTKYERAESAKENLATVTERRKDCSTVIFKSFTVVSLCWGSILTGSIFWNPRMTFKNNYIMNRMHDSGHSAVKLCRTIL